MYDKSARRSRCGWTSRGLVPLAALLAITASLLGGPATGFSTLTLQYSTAPNRANAAALNGASVSGNVYVFATPVTSDILRVRFWLNDMAMAGAPRQTENTPPYDFAGGSASTANPFDTRTLADGSHTITTRIDFVNGTATVFHATLVVANSDSVAPGKPDQIHLSWLGDPATTMTVVWRTIDPVAPSEVNYRLVGRSAWDSFIGTRRASGTNGTLHQGTLLGLAPAATYEYRVMGNGGVWSDIHQFRTAPATGPADFSVAFVADTGLIGRTDGLATGTAQVRDEIAKLRPALTLTGGDYIYYNTDKRYGSLNDSIDAWFNQMQPVAAYSPMMPTYGNHEVLLGESLPDWQRRFAHPTGHDGQNFYSFDVADVHFVSILAVSDTAGIPSAALAWIDQDMATARTRGQRWIIPYFHASAFGDGTNHRSNPELRRQFGPVFEKHGVKIALYTHDQAYERSYPLLGVPNAISITSNSLTCYGPEDGVTWVKTSPGGKLSNISKSFSPFASSTPPFWTAHRNNTIHNFGRLTFTAGGTARYEAVGVVGNGSTPVVIDRFEYRLAESCPPALRFDPAEVTLNAEEGETAELSVGLTTSNGSIASATLTDNASWLSVSPATATVPAPIQLTANTAGLAPGSYTASVTAAGTGLLQGTLSVRLQVSGQYTNYLSLTTGRANPVLLDGGSVSGDIYVFALPATSVTRVEFFLDDPGMINSPIQVENNGPHDLAGTRSDGTAFPFDTATLADGSHTLTTRLGISGGSTVIVQSAFTVANNAPPASALLASPASLAFSVLSGNIPSPQSVSVSSSDAAAAAYTAAADVPWISLAPAGVSTPGTVSVSVSPAGLPAGTHTGTVTLASPTHGTAAVAVSMMVGSDPATHSLVYSTSANRANPRALSGATVSGNLYAFSTPDTPDVDRVEFWLDNPTMSGSPRRSEGNEPYDFAGGTVTKADAFAVGSIATGSHTITTKVYFVNGTSNVFHTTFTVVR